MQLDLQSLDSVTGSVTGPTVAPASSPLTDVWAAARPGTLALLGLFVVAVVLSWYLLRVPYDYPFRAKALALTMLGALATSIALGVRGWHAAPALVYRGREAWGAVLSARPAGPLADYVPLVRGAGPPAPVRPPPPAARAVAEWQCRAPIAGTAVIAFYRMPPHHSGWTLEFDAPTLLVFRRAVRAVGTTGTERLRIQVPSLPASSLHDPAGTRVDYVLTRRF
jgi:hypothetical protein